MTNTYLTGNPLGSSAPKDLYDNASNFDDGLNGPAPSFQDRNRLRRMSWAGFEAQAAAAIQQVGWVFTTPLDYAAGIVISLPNQVFRNGTEYYRAGPSLTLPYTTTGVWGTEGPNFVSVGDAALRSELASISGAEMVGYKRPETGAVRVTTGSVLALHRTPEQFGAIGNAFANDQVAFQNALNSFPVGVRGVLYASGNYIVDRLTIPDYVVVEGPGVIQFTATTGDLCTVGIASSILRMTITHRADPTSTTMIRIIGSRGKVEGCTITNYFQGITVGSTSIFPIFPVIRDNGMFAPKAGTGSGAVFLQNYSNVVFQDNVITGPAYPLVQPDYGLRIHNGDTCFVTDNNITAHGIALYMDVPVGLNNFALRVSGSLFDSATIRTDATIVDSALISPLGNIYDALFTTCWFGLSLNGNGLQLGAAASGQVNGITFNNCQFVGNAIGGLNVVSPYVRNLQVNGGYASGNAVYGVSISADVGEFQINGIKAGAMGARGANGRGINVNNGTSNGYMITNCIIRGNTTFDLYDGGTGSNKIIAQNIIG